MITSFAPIMGVQVGFEFYEQEHKGNRVNYFLLDLFIMRVQFAWYGGEID